MFLTVALAADTGPPPFAAVLFLLFLYVLFLLPFFLFYIGLPVVGVFLAAWQAPKIVFHNKGLRKRAWKLGLVFVAIGSWLLLEGLVLLQGLVWGTAAVVEGIILFVLSAGMVANEVKARRTLVPSLEP